MNSQLPPMAMASNSSLTMLLNSRFSMAGSSGPPSEAASSEISSVESNFSDLKSIALGLGIVDPEEVYTERFKVDRLKLEDMIKSASSDKYFRCELLIETFVFSWRLLWRNEQSRVLLRYCKLTICTVFDQYYISNLSLSWLRRVWCMFPGHVVWKSARRLAKVSKQRNSTMALNLATLKP